MSFMPLINILLCAVCAIMATNIIPEKTLLVVPGMSLTHANRTKTVLQNMELLFKHDSNFHCLIHVYSNSIPAAVKNKFSVYGCALQYFHESNHYADYLKTLVPSLLRHGEFHFVMILLDDVALQPTFRYN